MPGITLAHGSRLRWPLDRCRVMSPTEKPESDLKSLLTNLFVYCCAGACPALLIGGIGYLLYRLMH
jgi:hypothetical protein